MSQLKWETLEEEQAQGLYLTNEKGSVYARITPVIGSQKLESRTSCWVEFLSNNQRQYSRLKGQHTLSEAKKEINKKFNIKEN